MRRHHALTVLFAGMLVGLGCRSDPDSPLTIAAAAGRTEEIEALLSDGAEVDAVDGSGMTPLGTAARSGRIDALRVLIDAGADVDRPTGSNDWTPLIHAVHKNQDGAAIALLRAGAETDGPGAQRALRMAAGYGNAELVRALLEHGVAPRRSGRTNVLTEAVGGAWDIDYQWRGCEPHTETVRVILEAAPDLRLPDNFWTKLARRHALKKGCTEMLRLVGAANEDDPDAFARLD